MVMKASGDAENLAVLGHKVEIFIDISHFIIQKRWIFKPLLKVFSRKTIKYFTYENKPYAFTNFVDGER